jgi:Fe-Mn family superoxide dismutase
MAQYTLPDLPYDYSALEPHISGQIVELHHSKHHQAYVTGLNTALEQLEEARSKGELGTITKLEKDLAFNLAGHINHSVFWKNQSPDGGDKPAGDLGQAIEDNFGSWDGFQAQFTQAATTIQGNGWATLEWEPLGQRLIIQQFYDHQNNLAVGTHPLLMLDVWEHAFYLQYKNVKADYVKAFWNVINWDDVAARYAAAQSITIG